MLDLIITWPPSCIHVQIDRCHRNFIFFYSLDRQCFVSNAAKVVNYDMYVNFTRYNWDLNPEKCYILVSQVRVLWRHDGHFQWMRKTCLVCKLCVSFKVDVQRYQDVFCKDYDDLSYFDIHTMYFSQNNGIQVTEMGRKLLSKARTWPLMVHLNFATWWPKSQSCIQTTWGIQWAGKMPLWTDSETSSGKRGSP